MPMDGFYPRITTSWMQTLSFFKHLRPVFEEQLTKVSKAVRTFQANHAQNEEPPFCFRNGERELS